MAQNFRHLFSPIRLGSTEIRNRIVSSAHAEMMADRHVPGDRFIAYCAEKAKGGVGMMITGVAAIHPTSVGHPEKEAGGTILQIWDDRVIPHYRRLADEVHRYGAKILVQLWHGGINASSQDSYREVWGPSPVPSISYRDMPHEMTHGEIAEIVDAFASAGARMKAAGVDGVELHAGSGYLLNQFLSPYTNKRTDEYGGDRDGRLRFVREVTAAVRGAVGKDFIVGMKLDADEYVPGGLTIEDAVYNVKQLEPMGALDYFMSTCGIYHTLFMIIPTMRMPMGYADHLAAGIREAVEHTPVIALGRIKDAVQAEKLLADGIADMVGMTRAIISDPEMPNKVRTGRIEEVRNCVGCNQGCVGRLFVLRAATCIQNPAIGYERELGIGTIKPAARRKKVLVIGGGPAGLEAARIAALRGHAVTLCERRTELGGQVAIHARAARREEFGDITRWLAREATRLGCDIRLGVEMNADAVRSGGYDAVVCATGSRPQMTGFSTVAANVDHIPGVELGHVLSAEDVLLGSKPIGRHVAVIDDEGNYRAPVVAEHLAEMGHQVELITWMAAVFQDLAPTLEQGLYIESLLEHGAGLHAMTHVKAIRANELQVYNIYSGKEWTMDGINSVVLCMHNRPNDELYRALSGHVPELHYIGDCRAPRRVLNAIYEGTVVGRQL